MSIVDGNYPKVKGLNVEPVLLVPTNAQGTGNSIPAGATVAVCGANTNGVNDFVVLPNLANVEDGHTITVVCNSAGMEIRTPSSSGELINNTDSDGSNEYTVPSGYQIHKFTKISNTVGWMGQGYTAIGAVVTAIVPDA